MKTISLTQGKETIVDDEDYEVLMMFKWSALQQGNGKIWYAVTNSSRTLPIPRTLIAMHRFILGPYPGKEIDHVNGDGLDNRKSNLRRATRAQNTANGRAWGGISKYRGVTRDTADTWVARVRVSSVVVYSERFATEIEAAQAYDREAIKAFGEFARPNFERGASTSTL